MRALRTSLIFLGALVAAILTISVAALGWLTFMPGLRNIAPAGACHEVRVNSNGFHSDIVIPADILPADHPFRRLYPYAHTFSIGWGDAGAYRFGDQQPWRHVDAILPPSDSLLHVEADPPAPGRTIAISEEGARSLVAFLDRSTRLAPDGRPIIVAEGLAPGRSVFIESPDQFHVFRLCNQWTAEALQAAGLPMTPFATWSAQALLKQTEHFKTCPRR